MADYKELLRRAVEALPENNGAARRAVYEKARAALVGQLRAINPPLAARDITAHRLQLEDCIRQVEQEASEAVIAGLGAREDNVPPPPVYFEPPPKSQSETAAPAVARPVARQLMAGKDGPRPLPTGNSIEEIIAAANTESGEKPAAAEGKSRSIARPEAKPMGKPVPKLVPSSRPRPASRPVAELEVEDEGADEADEVVAKEAVAEPEAVESAAPPAPKTNNGRPLPSIVARAEAVKSRSSQTAFGAPFEGPRRGPMLEPRRESGPRLQPAARGGGSAAARTATAPMALFADQPVAAAMSAVREVELEPEVSPVDPQGAIDRAIATLDREAKADPETERPAEPRTFHPVNDDDVAEEEQPPQAEAEAEAGDADPLGSAVMPESSLFGRDGSRLRKEKPAKAPKTPKPKRAEKAPKPAKPAKVAKRRGAEADDEDDENFVPPRARRRGGMGAVTVFLIVFALLLVGAGGAGFWAWREGYVDLDAMFGRSGATPVAESASVVPAPTSSSGSETPVTGPGNTDTPATTADVAPELKQTDRLTADAQPAVEAPADPVTEPLALVDPGKTEERLGAAETPDATAEQAVASLDPATAVGSQSLLLERADTGVTVPFSGTVDWSKGTDERGLPTVVGKASIPARNLGVDILIRKNSDPSLPASHLMEVNFRVSDAFIGGSIAGLPGVLLKNEELVQGTPLVGASARVVGNSFLFALSAAPEDITTNTQLLTGRKWMDLALIYATGKRAIITLEKDDAAVAMFNEVAEAWSAQASAE